MKSSLDDIARDNKNLFQQNQLLLQQVLENSVPKQPDPTPAPAPSMVDPSLFKELIKAMYDQTAELRTARTNQEAKASKKTPKNNVFPACTATNAELFLIWDNKILAIMATLE